MISNNIYDDGYLHPEVRDGMKAYEIEYTAHITVMANDDADLEVQLKKMEERIDCGAGVGLEERVMSEIKGHSNFVMDLTSDIDTTTSPSCAGCGAELSTPRLERGDEMCTACIRRAGRSAARIHTPTTCEDDGCERPGFRARVGKGDPTLLCTEHWTDREVYVVPELSAEGVRRVRSYFER